MAERLQGNWVGEDEDDDEPLDSISYHCGFCGREVASVKGWELDVMSDARIRVCPNCNRPTFFEEKSQYPGVEVGESVRHLPPDVESLYNEARASAAAEAPTAAILSLRKLLMNIAVNKGAAAGLSFQQYVDYLASKGFVPADGKEWVDHIRNKGNEANHQIVLMKPEDADELITFAGMLLKFIYEFPSRLKKPSTK